MKKDIRKQVLFNIVITSILMAALFMFTRVEFFQGNLDEYTQFTVVASDDSGNGYQLLRITDTIEKDVRYALYSKNYNNEFSFYYNEELVLYISDELFVDDYYVFTIPRVSNELVRLEVVNDSALLYEVSFIDVDNYIDSNQLQDNEADYGEIMVDGIVVNRNIFFDLFDQNSKVVILVIGVIIFSVILASLPYDYFFEKIRLEKIKKYFGFAMKHLIITIFWISITMFVLVTFFADDKEGSSYYDDVLYFSEENTVIKMNVYVGITDWVVGDSDYGDYTVTYKVDVFTKSSDVYSVSFLCGEDYFGSVKSIKESNDLKVSDDREIDFYSFDDCFGSNQFSVIVREVSSGITIYESDEYDLYKEPFQTIEVFDMQYDDSGKYVVIGIVLFHLIVTTTITELLLYKLQKKEEENYLEKDNKKQI